MSDRPISDYGFLSDCHSAALVSREGSLDWLCFPRFDSPSLFARLLDPGGGHWQIEPAGEYRVRRRYLDRSLVLETTFETATGVAVLVDALAVGPNERGHELGRDAPHVLLRTISCPEGHVDLKLSFAPRPEFGLIYPLFQEAPGGWIARGGPVVLGLSSPVALSHEDSTLRGAFTLRTGEGVGFALECRASFRPQPELWSREEIERRLQETCAAWRSWSEMHQRYEGPWRDLVLHTGRILQGLTYQPSGAIVAAATTSLPETVGGERNWDYRYAWVRDASLTLEALWVAACPDEAQRFLGFFIRSAGTQLRRGMDLQIMFGIGGEHDLSERELSHLRGWRDSRPVRCGNGAWNQRQIDVYGELMLAAHRLREQLEGLSDAEKDFFRQVAHTAARRWKEKDRGIWEVRGPERHYLYSKLMCWVALDRAIDIAELLDAGTELESWKEAREEIREAILARGFDESLGAFTQSFDSEDLDASNLMIPIVGFLPAKDPRVLSTIEATERNLTDEKGLVYRYRSHDGLEGEEGAFIFCTFWLAHALALAGRVERAREVFESVAGYANDLGLLSEEVDSRTDELLGNFPQAFSHIGLVNAAWAIARAEAG